jgi:hypothetical protein
MIFLGIDPGRLGAVAWMDGTRQQIEVHDCPLSDDGFDFAGMDTLLANALTECRGEGCRATLEDTISVPHRDKRGIPFLPASDKGLHLSLGAWLALLGARHIQTALVTPRTWKRTMLAGIANDKPAEAMALERRFQGHPICKKLHGPRGGIRDGRVDALFLAEYTRMMWKLSVGAV